MNSQPADVLALPDAPPPNPQTGGSYLRDEAGQLTLVHATVSAGQHSADTPQQPDAAAASPAATQE